MIRNFHVDKYILRTFNLFQYCHFIMVFLENLSNIGEYRTTVYSHLLPLEDEFKKNSMWISLGIKFIQRITDADTGRQFWSSWFIAAQSQFNIIEHNGKEHIIWVCVYQIPIWFLYTIKVYNNILGIQNEVWSIYNLFIKQTIIINFYNGLQEKIVWGTLCSLIDVSNIMR